MQPLKIFFAPLFAIALILSFSGCQNNQQQDAGNGEAVDTTAVQAEPANMLTDAEKAEGWTLLFDGSSLNGWHLYNNEDSSLWTVEDGTITRKTGAGGDRDLVTDQEFDNFEFSFEWKISPGGNSGVMYNVVEDPKYPTTYATGPEYQVIDNNGYEGDLTDKQKAASNYDMHAASQDATKPVGEWNQGRIVVNGQHVEHWLNGTKVVEYDVKSDDWTKRYKESKWTGFPGYATGEKGRLALQDHGHQVWYRNLKVKQL